MKSNRRNPVDAAVGERLRDLRRRHHLSQLWVGERLGVSFQQIQKYENGTNRISAARLAQLAQLFEIPVAALFGQTSDSRNAARIRSVDPEADKVARLVRAFQALKDPALKLAFLWSAEEMVRCQRSGTARR